MANLPPTNNTSGHIGIHQGYNGKWVVQLHANNKVISLGTHNTLEQAIEARQAGEKKYRKKKPLVKLPSKLKQYKSRIRTIMPPELFEEYLRYDPDEGKLYWTKSPSFRIFPDKNGNWPEAGYTDSNGYRKVRLKNKIYSISRLIYFLENGYYSEVIDHKDRNQSNNHISNLIGTTYAGNSKNMKLSKANRSGHTGVKNTYKDSWIAEIDYDGNHRHLGTFTTYEEACAVRQEAERVFGFSPIHGKRSN